MMWIITGAVGLGGFIIGANFGWHRAFATIRANQEAIVKRIVSAALRDKANFDRMRGEDRLRKDLGL